MPILVGRDGGVQPLELPEIQQTHSRTTASLDDAVNAPVTFVPKRSGPFAWLGSLGESIRSGFRRAMLPAAACLVAGTMLLGGCASAGHHLRTAPIAGIGVQQQHQKVDLDQVKRILEASDASELAAALQGVPNPRSVLSWLQSLDDADATLALLQAKMHDKQGRADLEGLDSISQVLQILDMEITTKSSATPVIGVHISGANAHLTEPGGKWDEDKNRAWTITELGPNGSADLLLFCPVSGHAHDVYPDELYQKYTQYQTAPKNEAERSLANATIYSHNNSQYIYLTDDPTSYQMGKIVVADVKANGRFVTPVRVHLEGLEPGKTYEVRWSPFVGSDPNNPTVGVGGFKNGRSFRLIIPQNVTIAQR